jgi:hypothetical protein
VVNRKFRLKKEWFFVAPQPKSGLGHLVVDVYGSHVIRHTHTHTHKHTHTHTDTYTHKHTHTHIHTHTQTYTHTHTHTITRPVGLSG